MRIAFVEPIYDTETANLWQLRASHKYPSLLSGLVGQAEIHLVMGRWPPESDPLRRALEERFGVSFHCYDGPSSTSDNDVGKLAGMIAGVLSSLRPDVVSNLTGRDCASYAATALAAKRVGARYVMRLGGDDVATKRANAVRRSENFDTSRGFWRMTAHERIAAALADGVIVMNEQEGRRVIGIGARPAAVHVATRGVDGAVFRPAEARRENGLWRAIFVGRPTHEKGYDILQAAAALVSARDPSVRILLAGQFEPGEKGNLVTLGFIPPPELPEVYRTADAFVMTSRSEGMPQAVMEASACGLPCILPQALFADRLIDGVDALLTDNSPEAVAEAILRLRNDSALANGLGARSRELALTRYSVAQSESDYRAALLPADQSRPSNEGWSLLLRATGSGRYAAGMLDDAATEGLGVAAWVRFGVNGGVVNLKNAVWDSANPLASLLHLGRAPLMLWPEAAEPILPAVRGLRQAWYATDCDLLIPERLQGVKRQRFSSFGALLRAATAARNARSCATLGDLDPVGWVLSPDLARRCAPLLLSWADGRLTDAELAAVLLARASRPAFAGVFVTDYTWQRPPSVLQPSSASDLLGDAALWWSPTGPVAASAGIGGRVADLLEAMAFDAKACRAHLMTAAAAVRSNGVPALLPHVLSLMTQGVLSIRRFEDEGQVARELPGLSLLSMAVEVLGSVGPVRLDVTLDELPSVLAGHLLLGLFNNPDRGEPGLRRQLIGGLAAVVIDHTAGREAFLSPVSAEMMAVAAAVKANRGREMTAFMRNRRRAIPDWLEPSVAAELAEVTGRR